MVIYLLTQIGLEMSQSFVILQGDANLTRIHHHVTGVLNHGQRKSYAFTWTDKFHPDTNITISCQLPVLEDASEVSYCQIKILISYKGLPLFCAVMYLHEQIRNQFTENRLFHPILTISSLNNIQMTSYVVDFFHIDNTS